MASGSERDLYVPMPWARAKKKGSGQQKRIELEQEVVKLHKTLDQEEKVHEILQRAFDGNVGSIHRIPSFLPPKMKELLIEVAIVEKEIVQLEGEISNLQQGLNQDQNYQDSSPKSKEGQHGNLNINAPHGISSSPPNPIPQHNGVHERHAPETRAMFFINKAITGDYTLKGFRSDKKMENSKGTIDIKENQREVRFQEKVSKKSGLIEKHVTMKLPPKPPMSKSIEQDSEPPFNHLHKSLTNSGQIEESNQKLTPNKLSESIMKCLTCIFLRLIRTSRAMEIEKSSMVSKSAQPFSRSRSFRDESGFNPKTSLLLQREVKQPDPYGIFEIEDSLPRDIGPYKNLVRFTSSSLDMKSISSSITLLRKLRVLLNSLHNVDLRFLTYQQKLAFWINMYNACIMHGFLQFGLPSSPEKVLALMNKAVLNIGGNKLNALAIEHFILRQPSNLKETYWKVDNEDKEGIVRRIYGLEHPEPNVTFALCCGSRSSPAVRIYTADGISAELEKSKLDYLQASIVVTTTKKLVIPKILLWNMYDFAKDMDSLVEWVCNQLPTSGSLRKSMVECLRSSNNGRISDLVEVMPYEFEFQYLLVA